MRKLKNNMKLYNISQSLYIMVILFYFFNLLSITAFAENITPYLDVSDANMQYQLGVMFERGDGVKQNDWQARLWFKRAAIQDHAMAQFNLAWMYANGYGGKKDNILAYIWFLKAADAGIDDAKPQLMALDRIISFDDKSYAISKSNGDKDNYIRPNIINKKDIQISFIDARRNYNNNNFKSAILKLNQLANNDYVEAQNLLGLHLMSSINESDRSQAFRWLFIAAKQGNAAARYNLAISFSKGIGTHKNLTKALRWLGLARQSVAILNGYDYQEISQMFKEKSEYLDPYIAAQQGYISASSELMELIKYSLIAISAQQQSIDN